MNSSVKWIYLDMIYWAHNTEFFELARRWLDILLKDISNG